jgi:hypothetical protein
LSGEKGDRCRSVHHADILVLARERHTGTLISLASIRAILDYEPFKGIVAVDEAYIDFSEPGSSAVSRGRIREHLRHALADAEQELPA